MNVHPHTHQLLMDLRRHRRAPRVLTGLCWERVRQREYDIEPAARQLVRSVRQLLNTPPSDSLLATLHMLSKLSSSASVKLAASSPIAVDLPPRYAALCQSGLCQSNRIERLNDLMSSCAASIKMLSDPLSPPSTPSVEYPFAQIRHELAVQCMHMARQRWSQVGVRIKSPQVLQSAFVDVLRWGQMAHALYQGHAEHITRTAQQLPQSLADLDDFISTQLESPSYLIAHRRLAARDGSC